MKVPDYSYPDWHELKKYVLRPAVEEANRYSEEAGFVVNYEDICEGKSHAKIKFSVTKLASREDREAMLQGKAKRAPPF
jgi:plasmid replication initiation protein